MLSLSVCYSGARSPVYAGGQSPLVSLRHTDSSLGFQKVDLNPAVATALPE